MYNAEAKELPCEGACEHVIGSRKFLGLPHAGRSSFCSYSHLVRQNSTGYSPKLPIPFMPEGRFDIPHACLE